jgi:hypothetical protein
MSHLPRVVAMLEWSGELRGEKFKRSLILSGFLIALTSCGIATSRDIRAYNTCLARHLQEAVLCEGPLQAYELDPVAFQARAASIGPSTNSSYDALSPAVHPTPTPVPLHPNGMTSSHKD